MIHTEDKKLNNAIAKGVQVNGRKLNYYFFLGCFIFGPIVMDIAFASLGRRILSWVYALLLVLAVLFSGRFFLIVDGEWNLVAAAVMLLPFIVYLGAWFHASVIVKQYQAIAKMRVETLSQVKTKSINEILEEGLLRSRALCDSSSAVSCLEEALNMEGGDVELLKLAGTIMFEAEKYSSASAFFDRIIERPSENGVSKGVKNLRAMSIVFGKTTDEATSNITKQCPWCKSVKVARLSSSKAVLSVSGDRRCRDCGLIWSPPVPKWAAIIFLIAIAPLFAIFVSVGIAGLVDAGFHLGYIFSILFAFACGYICLQAFKTLYSNKSQRIGIHEVPAEFRKC